MNLAQLRLQWAVKFLLGIAKPVSVNNLIGIVAWMIGEGGGVQTENVAYYNPLNCTLRESGSWSINYANVQAYTSSAQGLLATCLTIENGLYGPILTALGNSSAPNVFAAAVGMTEWGTPTALILDCLAEASDVVNTYLTPGDAMFIQVGSAMYQLIYDGADSYWRGVSATLQPTVPAFMIIQDPQGLWLALWKIGAKG